MVTNTIGNAAKPTNDNIFASLQIIVNEALKNILPAKSEKLYVVSPLAIYYEHKK